jgi:hypothetical protein
MRVEAKESDKWPAFPLSLRCLHPPKRLLKMLYLPETADQLSASAVVVLAIALVAHHMFPVTHALDPEAQVNFNSLPTNLKTRKLRASMRLQIDECHFTAEDMPPTSGRISGVSVRTETTHQVTHLDGTVETIVLDMDSNHRSWALPPPRTFWHTNGVRGPEVGHGRLCCY